MILSFRTAALLLISIPLVAAVPEPSPAQAEIAQAAKAILQARDTQNPADFTKAWASASKALALDPTSFDAQRYQAMALLGKQDLPAALALISKLNKRIPDDIGIWALLSEVQAAQGNYAEAEKSAQWVLDLRRNSPLGFSSSARLREVFGDDQGAAEFYSEAVRRTPQPSTEERSWLLVQIARTQLRQNELDGAASLLDQAAKLSPDSVQLLEQQAALATRRNDNAKAVTLLEKENQLSPTPAHLYLYARALDRAGKHPEAQAAYDRFEANPAGAETDLIFYWSDRKKNPQKALTIATEQISRRQDVATRDAYAWALYSAGDVPQARKQMEELLAIGTRAPRYTCHSAEISTQAIPAACQTLP